MTARDGDDVVDGADEGRNLPRQVTALLDPAAQRSSVPEKLARKLSFDHDTVSSCELPLCFDPQRVEARLKIVDVAPHTDPKPNGQGISGLSCPSAKAISVCHPIIDNPARPAASTQGELQEVGPLHPDRDANLLSSPRKLDLLTDAETPIQAAPFPLLVTPPLSARPRRASLVDQLGQLVWGGRKHHHQPNQFVAYPFRRRVNFDPLWNELIGFNLAGPIKMWLPCDRRRLDVIAGTIPILGDLRARELGVPLCGSFGFGELLEDWPKQDEISVSLLRDLSKPSGTFALPYLCSKYRSFSLIFFSRDCFWLLRCGFDQDSSSGCPNRSPRSTCSDERPLDC